MSRKIIKTSLWFTVLSGLASAFNFLYYPVTARTLSLSEFGDVQIGISFIMQAAALFTSLNTLALFFAAQKGDQSPLIARLERVVIGLSFILAVFTVIFAQPLSAILQLHDPSLLYILAVIFILNIPAATWLGSLQGEGQFIASGAIAVVSSLTKILVGVGLIVLGFGAQGALIGILAGSFIVMPLAYFAQKSQTLHIAHTFSLPKSEDFRLFLGRPRFVILFGSLFILALASTVDVVAAKTLLHPDVAGLYAQLSTAGKIPYFAAVPVAIISFERLMKQLGKPRYIVGFYCALVLILTIATIALEAVIMQLFFGLGSGDYSTQAFLMTCIAFSCYAVSTLLIYSLISLRRLVRVGIAALVILFIPLYLLFSGSSEIDSIARTYMVGQIIALLVAGALQYTGSHE